MSIIILRQITLHVNMACIKNNIFNTEPELGIKHGIEDKMRNWRNMNKKNAFYEVPRPIRPKSRVGYFVKL